MNICDNSDMALLFLYLIATFITVSDIKVDKYDYTSMSAVKEAFCCPTSSILSLNRSCCELSRFVTYIHGHSCVSGTR